MIIIRGDERKRDLGKNLLRMRKLFYVLKRDNCSDIDVALEIYTEVHKKYMSLSNHFRKFEPKTE